MARVNPQPECFLRYSTIFLQCRAWQRITRSRDCWAEWIVRGPIHFSPRSRLGSGRIQHHRRSVLDRIGFFDERFFLYYEEVDLCRRVKAAKREVWYWPDIVVEHLGGESAKPKTIQRS